MSEQSQTTILTDQLMDAINSGDPKVVVRYATSESVTVAHLQTAQDILTKLQKPTPMVNPDGATVKIIDDMDTETGFGRSEHAKRRDNAQVILSILKEIARDDVLEEFNSSQIQKLRAQREKDRDTSGYKR